ncbi:hypothetical protein DFP74_4419 [Nocardiopsis sp. Huas11]|uniref:hypothetical protein n=1 Tax=Nocardiopsis sp. Huas11 TaxID=2183912 RepID=UPI000EB1DFCA|nr:hypothetical protein [Nocardiopsis sp. Huas11]RKS08700.1 hypothetical protein DFP74_4419 [Nocardiopsis sp. Huas11]
MEAAAIALIVAVVFGVFIMFAVASSAADRRRREGLADWARTQGLAYAEQRPDLVRRFSGTPFRGGRGAKAKNVLSGRWRDRSVTVYEYSYTTSSSNGQTTTTTTHKFTIVAVATGATPVLQVKDKHLGHRLLDLIGIGDLELGDEKFDERFHLQCDDAAFARTALDQDTRRWLGSRPDVVPFRLSGDHLVLWTNGTLPPERIRNRVDAAVDLVERLLSPVDGPVGD